MKKSVSWASVIFPEATERLGHNVGYTRHSSHWDTLSLHMNSNVIWGKTLCEHAFCQNSQLIWTTCDLFWNPKITLNSHGCEYLQVGWKNRSISTSTLQMLLHAAFVSKKKLIQSMGGEREVYSCFWPRITQPYQMEEFCPILTSPITAALGATKTVSSITGDLSNSFIIVWCLDTAREREREQKLMRLNQCLKPGLEFFWRFAEPLFHNPITTRDNAKLLIHAHGQSTHTHTSEYETNSGTVSCWWGSNPNVSRLINDSALLCIGPQKQRREAKKNRAKLLELSKPLTMNKALSVTGAETKNQKQFSSSLLVDSRHPWIPQEA